MTESKLSIPTLDQHRRAEHARAVAERGAFDFGLKDGIEDVFGKFVASTTVQGVDVSDASAEDDNVRIENVDDRRQSDSELRTESIDGRPRRFVLLPSDLRKTLVNAG